jgi:NAD(P)-dependent dehydrogenase (short-subunit alcohol dehydrogenase family)
MNGYADDLAAVIETLDLKDATLVGHSTGGGEVARYIGRHGTKRVKKAVLIAAVPPIMLKTPANPEGLPIEVFDGIRAGVAGDRSQYYKDLAIAFYGANRPGAKVSQGTLDQFWLWSMQAGAKNAYESVKAFSETDFTEDLKKFDIPTLVLHGEDDQIVPVKDSALDVLVNNAGAGSPRGLAETTPAHLQGIYAANVFGPALLAAAAVPHLELTRGCIVNISSTLARKPLAGFADYAASKAALEQMTRCWALELASAGVRVNAIAAGPVETGFLEERMGFAPEEAEAIREREQSLIPLGRRGEPEDVAAWILALASGSAGWVTGQVLGVDGGFAVA